MLGDAILLVEPNIYCLILQLIYEAVSFIHKLKSGEEVIYLRRITDIVSPFENGVTEYLPVEEIYQVKNLDLTVRLFCMREISTKEKKRLLERRLVPQSLVSNHGNNH